MNRWIILLGTALLALTLVAASCGGDNGDEAEEPPATEPAPGEETTLQLAADPGGTLSYDTTSLEAPAGTITIELENASTVPHDVAVENGVDEASPTITEGSTTLTVDLESGQYTFYCSVPGHREAGMEGTLTVN